MKKNFSRYLFTVLFWSLSMFPLYAQGDPNDPFAENDPPTPIDSSIHVLVLAALTTGVYFLGRRSVRQEKKHI